MIETIYNCQSITKITHTWDYGHEDDPGGIVELSRSEYVVVLANGYSSRFLFLKVGGINSDNRDSLTEITGTPITSIKQELYCEDENDKQFRVYTKESE